VYDGAMQNTGRRLVPGIGKDRIVFDSRRTRDLIGEVLPNAHARRVESLANGVGGVLNAAVVSIHAIGQAYARLQGISAKSGVKQVDRLLSNSGVRLDALLKGWVQHVVGEHPEIVAAMDWTDFDDDDHTTLCVHLVTTHGRALPLAWKTVKKSELANRRNKLEDEMIERLHDWLPEKTRVVLLADRGFGRQDFYETLDVYGWDYVIRFKQDVNVEFEGQTLPARERVATNGRAQRFLGAKVTDRCKQVGAVVTVKAAKMKDSWCLATSLTAASAADVVKLYGRRFTIEETFRDTKDLHFGMGLRATHIRNADRRDRLLFLIAIALTLLSLLGAAAEEAGLDRLLKANTVKRRTHSLVRQGLYWYGAIANTREDWLRPLVVAFNRLVTEHAYLSQLFALPLPAAEAAK
jgi:hypothetical protein